MKWWLIFLVIGGSTLFLGVVLMRSVWQSPLQEALEVPVDHGVHHIGIIMDGNRRWARAHSLEPWRGHSEGIAAVKRTVKFCQQHGIKELTLYVFSLENFKRTLQEQDHLFSLINDHGARFFDELMQENVQVYFRGDRERFPASVRATIQRVEESTCHKDGMRINLLFCYGGQQELLAAMRTIAQKVADGQLDPGALDDAAVRAHMWTAGMTDPDLIIRTGGDQRLSNFLPYQAAYSDLYFTSVYWPDITENHLADALRAYCEGVRNRGA